MPRALKFALSSLLIGAMSVGLAYAGAILVPGSNAPTASSGAGGWLAKADNSSDQAEEGVVAASGVALEPLKENQVYAGAHKVNIAPRAAAYGGEWNTTDCDSSSPLGSPPPKSDPTDFRVRWLENSNCIYAGGYDIGPANAITNFDEEFGLWARATAISDGEDTVVLMILDGAYYFAKYGQMCNDDTDHASVYDGEGPGANTYTQDCGFRDLQNSMAAKYGYTADTRGELGIEPASFLLASSHAHASPDFVGAWGGVPRWYMQQVEDAIREAVYGAIDSMEPAFIEAGEVLYRGGNNNRRGHYHAAEEATEAWMRFVAENASGTPAPPGKRTVATIGTYAAHPVDSVDEGRGYADLAGVFAARAEERFGGIGLFFQTGFGNISSRGSRRGVAEQLVNFIPDVGHGPQVTGSLDVKSVMRTFDQPATNVVLSAGGASGVFDRPFEARPSAISIGKGSLSPEEDVRKGMENPEDFQDMRAPHKRCNSASALTVNSSVSVAKIGSLLITGGPGELFSNYTNTIKEQYRGGIAFPLSLVNDGLGYIMQSIETDHVGRQAVGFVNGPLSEYEDAYSIDGCFGDHALEQTLAGIQQLLQ